MRDRLSRNWWVLALRGVVAIVLGLMAFFWPGSTVTAVVMVFGVYALIDGVFLVAAGLQASHGTARWWAPVLEGALGCIVGLMALFMPLATAVAVTLLMGGWALVTGIIEIVAAVTLRKEIEGEWLLGAVGVLSIVLGVALLAAPGAGLLAWIWMFGAYALVVGVMLIGLAFRLRGHGESRTASTLDHGPTSKAA